MTILVAVALVVSAGCAGESHKKKRHTSPPVTPPPVVEPPINHPCGTPDVSGCITYFYELPDGAGGEVDMARGKVWAGAFRALTDIAAPETSATVKDVPVGLTSVEVTAWDLDTHFADTLFSTLLAFGEKKVGVIGGQEIAVTVPLLPSRATVAPLVIDYGSTVSVSVAPQVSFLNWPLSLRQAPVRFWLTDPEFNYFQFICESEQTLEDTETRGCVDFVSGPAGTFPPGYAPFPPQGTAVVFAQMRIASWDDDPEAYLSFVSEPF
ncbi:MAG: hypothetical protein A3D67_00985 [Candidatus Lloydbacteria bacterium RIFCSPHIGHO2_02_FULL_51_22]|nr:MAG: hypothetical protein A3D67_00985 [Candidatus Lloydbacteria bacterium RIFCSPHIGHO2_02_FULL_51_22]